MILSLNLISRTKAAMKYLKEQMYKAIERSLKRGRLTATELAKQFQCSEDTAYRRIKEYQAEHGITFDPVERTWKA